MNFIKQVQLRLRESLDLSQFGSHIAITMVTNISIAILSLISGVMVARLLGATGRGELAAIQTWPSILAVFAMLGIPDSLVYFSAKEPENAGRWLTTAITIALFACVPFMVAGYLMPLRLKAQTQQIIQAAQEYLWLLPIFAVTGMLLHPLRGKNDIKIWNLLRPMQSIVWICVLVVGFFIGTTNPAIVAQNYLIVFALLALPIGYVVKRRLVGSFIPSFGFVRPILNYGIPSVLSSIPIMLNLRLDQMLMVSFLEPRKLGLYAVGVAWSSAVAPLLNSVSSIILPRVAGSNSKEEQSQLLAQSVCLGAGLAIIVSTGVAFLSTFSIPLLFGIEFAPAIPAAIILAVAGGFSGLNQILEAGILGLGEPRFVLIAEAAGLVITAILLLLLLGPFELIGAAIASLVSYSFVTLLLIINKVENWFGN